MRRKYVLIALTLALSLGATDARAHNGQDHTGETKVWLMGWNPATGVYVREVLSITRTDGSLVRYDVPDWSFGRPPATCRIGGMQMIMWYKEVAGTLVPWPINPLAQLIFPVVALSVNEPLWKLKGCADFNGDGDEDFIWWFDKSAGTPLP